MDNMDKDDWVMFACVFVAIAFIFIAVLFD